MIDKIADYVDIDTRRAMNVYRKVHVPNLELKRPVPYYDGVYFVPNRFLFNTWRHTMSFSVHDDRYVEFNYKTHEVLEFCLNRHFKVYVHPDFKDACPHPGQCTIGNA